MACYLQSGIQTQWNIWDEVFYENSRRAVRVNNCCKKVHIIFHLRGSEFDPDLKHSDKLHKLNNGYIAYDILCCKSNFKKRKHFTAKKEDSFLMSLFLSSCFSFQTRIDLFLVKFYYNTAVRRFLKTFRKFARKRLWWKPFLGKFLVIENGLR